MLLSILQLAWERIWLDLYNSINSKKKNRTILHANLINCPLAMYNVSINLINIDSSNGSVLSVPRHYQNQYWHSRNKILRNTTEYTFYGKMA